MLTSKCYYLLEIHFCHFFAWYAFLIIGIISLIVLIADFKVWFGMSGRKGLMDEEGTTGSGTDTIILVSTCIPWPAQGLVSGSIANISV